LIITKQNQGSLIRKGIEEGNKEEVNGFPHKMNMKVPTVEGIEYSTKKNSPEKSITSHPEERTRYENDYHKQQKWQCVIHDAKQDELRCQSRVMGLVSA